MGLETGDVMLAPRHQTPRGPGTFSPRLAEHMETFSPAHLAPAPLCGATSHAESFREGRLEMILAFSAELKKPASEAQSDLPGFFFCSLF
ncbi:hypothetical protein EYF80_056158 [Liparis tanakae]|uniref:Uncharacterized protein n=1 Tax=Liparis tanakae TaxID=230148 RepID=A0A4Z2EXV8_9TELE|nr:hypothetical protein EYF80_056158 [Liparis tanakae]